MITKIFFQWALLLFSGMVIWACQSPTSNATSEGTKVVVSDSIPAIAVSTLYGNWVKPIDGVPQETEGFQLNADQIAFSINMYTMPYKAWKYENNCIILSGKSIGNKTSSSITDTFKVIYVTDSSLVVERNSERINYTKSSNPKNIVKHE